MSTFNDGGEDDIVGAAVPILPTISSSYNMKEEKPIIKHDLWIVGAGTLGELVCKAYKEQNPTASIIAETATTTRHATLRGFGAEPRLRSDRSEQDAKGAKNLLICIPPSSAKDYLVEVNDAIRLWSGPLGEGNLVFTSSVAVYGDSNGNIVDENFRLDTRSNRSTILIAAEEAILHRQGNVIRLAGLYNDRRGPHTYWLKIASEGKSIDTNSNGLVNLIHYEDAANLVVAALQTGLKASVFLGVDNEPITKEEICRCALASKLFPNTQLPKFSLTDGPIGKTCNGGLTRSLLKWKPKYHSFRTYMRRLGGELIQDDKEVETTKKGNIDDDDDDEELVLDIPDLKSNKKPTKAKSSSLWIPTDEDDDGF